MDHNRGVYLIKEIDAISYYIVSNELYHHGILGQKWGVRRFQNPDGSLTAAGKRRYEKDAAQLSKYNSEINRFKYESSKARKKGDYVKAYKYEQFQFNNEKKIR